MFIVDDGNELDLGHVLLLVIENLGLFVMFLFNHFRILLWINYINVMICFIFIYYNMVIQSSVLNRNMNICTCWNCKLKAVHKLKFYLTSQNISKPSINGYEILYLIRCTSSRSTHQLHRVCVQFNFALDAFPGCLAVVTIMKAAF